MNTIELLRDLSKFVCSKNKGSWGVFALDQLPKEKISRPCLIICNSSPSSHPGTHWNGFYFGAGNKKAEFFDSFGRPPYKKQFIRFLKNNSSNYSYNNKKLQGNYSTVCGQFTILFLYYRCLNRSMKAFIKEFKLNNCDFNDRKIMKMYSRLVVKLNNRMHKNANQTGGNNNFITCNQTCTSFKKNKTQL